MKVAGPDSGLDITMRIRNGELNRRHYPSTIQEDPRNIILLHFNKLGMKTLIGFPPPDSDQSGRLIFKCDKRVPQEISSVIKKSLESHLVDSLGGPSLRMKEGGPGSGRTFSLGLRCLSFQQVLTILLTTCSQGMEQNQMLTILLTTSPLAVAASTLPIRSDIKRAVEKVL